MVIQDDRTPEQRKTHRVIVVGTDSFMSGWGGAKNGASYAGWACESRLAENVLAHVSARSEMKRVRIVSGDYRPKRAYCAHFHVYVVDESHRYAQPR